MKTKYLFTFLYYRERKRTLHEKLRQDLGSEPKTPEIENIRIEEHIVAESIHDALRYWKIDLLDEGVEFISITQQVPVVDVPPLPERGPFEKPTA